MWKKIVTAILKTTINTSYCLDKCLYLVSEAILIMKNAEKSQLAQEYFQQIKKQNISDEEIQNILLMFESIGESGQVIEDDIIALYKTKPSLANFIDSALLGIKSKKTADIYSNIFKNHPDPELLFEIAEKGKIASEVGVYILPLLFDQNHETRINAARTLGYIGYKPAVNVLIPLINDPIDIRLNWVAVEALGMIGNKKALKSLKKTAKNHWYKPVGQAAKKAIKNIKKGGMYEKPKNRSNIVYDYYMYDHIEAEQCETFYQKEVKESSTVKLYSSKEDKEIEKLSFSTEILSYGANDEEQQIAETPEGETPIIEVKVTILKNTLSQ